MSRILHRVFHLSRCEVSASLGAFISGSRCTEHTCASQNTATVSLERCSYSHCSSQSSRKWIWALLSSAGAAVAASAALTSTAYCNNFTEGIQSARKRQFFKYEKRLRQKSTHEKMFEYFSSEVTDGKHCMTAHDILRALIAVYPPDDASWSRSGSLDGERAPQIKSALSEEAMDFLNDFDIDGDGTFSYDEFVLFLVLLSMPLKDMQGLFAIMDDDGSETLDKKEFLDVIEGLVKFAGKASPSLISRSSFESSNSNGMDEPFINKWFGADGTKRMQFETFQKFLVQLHGIFDGMEFDMLDVKGKGHISGLELARSLVAPGPVTMIDALLDRAEGMPDRLLEAKIDRETFLKTQKLVRKFHRVSFPIFFWQDTGHSTDLAAMRRVVNKSCQLEVSDVVLEIFFQVFKDSEGKWDAEAVHGAMFNKYQHVRFEMGENEKSIFSCLVHCIAPTQP